MTSCRNNCGLARDLIRVPNLLSLSRVALAALFPVALVRGGPVFALLVLAIAGISDLLDGWWARHFHAQTALGATIDGLTDKIFVLAVVVTLVEAKTLSVFGALLLGTRDVGEILLAGRLSLFNQGRQKRGALLKKPHSANVPGKVATALQYMAVIAIILGSAPQSFWIGMAAIAGVVASVTYWIRETQINKNKGSLEDGTTLDGSAPK